MKTNDVILTSHNTSYEDGCMVEPNVTSQYLSNLLLGRLVCVPSCSSLNCVLPLNLKVEPRLKRLLVDGRLTISVLTVLQERGSQIISQEGSGIKTRTQADPNGPPKLKVDYHLMESTLKFSLVHLSDD